MICDYCGTLQAANQELPIERKYEWEAERRYLSNRIQQDKARFDELTDIINAMFPEARNG